MRRFSARVGCIDCRIRVFAPFSDRPTFQEGLPEKPDYNRDRAIKVFSAIACQYLKAGLDSSQPPGVLGNAAETQSRLVGQRVQPRRDVDAIAANVAAVDITSPTFMPMRNQSVARREHRRCVRPCPWISTAKRHCVDDAADSPSPNESPVVLTMRPMVARNLRIDQLIAR